MHESSPSNPRTDRAIFFGEGPVCTFWFSGPVVRLYQVDVDSGFLYALMLEGSASIRQMGDLMKELRERIADDTMFGLVSGRILEALTTSDLVTSQIAKEPPAWFEVLAPLGKRRTR